MSNVKEIIIPYTPRDFQEVLHKSCEEKKRVFAMIARQSGKTTFMINQLIKSLFESKTPMPRAGYIAPQRAQAKKIAWDPLKYYACSNPDLETESNESDLSIFFPGINGGARITLYGAENASALRGLSFDALGVDEVGNISKHTLVTILMPTLSARDGLLIVTGTPDGFNLLYDLHQMASTSDEAHKWAHHVYTINDTGLFTKDQIVEKRAESMAMENGSDTAFRQEYLCEFHASSDAVLISIELCMKALERIYQNAEVADYELVYGLDIAGEGGDHTILAKRQGPKIKELVRILGDTDAIASAVYQHALQDKPDKIYTDKGYNPGVTDRIRALGLNPIGIDFGGQAINKDKYANRRAEMWDNARIALEAGGSLPNDEEGKLAAKELSSVQMVDDGQGFKNRLQLESKRAMRMRGISSPDRGDAIALTHAHSGNVYAFRNQGGQYQTEAPDWNPFDRMTVNA